MKILCTLAMVAGLGAAASPAFAQESGTSAEQPAVDRSATGGAQTLEDILRRQRGEDVPLDQGNVGPAPNPEGAPGDLGVRGGASDSDLWRALRQGEAESFTTTNRDPMATTLVQNDGETWLAVREGPLLKYTGWAFGGILALLAVFMLLRGRIRIGAGRSGTRIRRFDFLERFAHWLLAGSFIILAVTGFGLLAGREVLVPIIDRMNEVFTHRHGVVSPDFGKETFASLIGAGKWAHNNLSWAFMLSLILVFVLWVFRNIPTWTDVKWFAKAGGLLSKNSHPPAKKFNGGQKLIFWSVILMGGSISASGLMLLWPYEFTMFAPTFDKINALTAFAGQPTELTTTTTPIQEQQYAATWHTIMAIILTTIIIAHIYIGSIGMQGAFAAMGSGKVDLNWAKEHHSLWVEKLEKDGKLVNADTGQKTTTAQVTPAE